jgi:hypothetical protein
VSCPRAAESAAFHPEVMVDMNPSRLIALWRRLSEDAQHLLLKYAEQLDRAVSDDVPQRQTTIKFACFWWLIDF